MCKGVVSDLGSLITLLLLYCPFWDRLAWPTNRHGYRAGRAAAPLLQPGREGGRWRDVADPRARRASDVLRDLRAAADPGHSVRRPQPDRAGGYLHHHRLRAAVRTVGEVGGGTSTGGHQTVAGSRRWRIDASEESTRPGRLLYICLNGYFAPRSRGYPSRLLLRARPPAARGCVASRVPRAGPLRALHARSRSGAAR